jgi:GT2 family glycosyltransferase
MSERFKQENEPHVTFIILNWNQCDMTLDCLGSVNKLDYENFDVIVVDNGSNDGSAERIRQVYPNTVLIENQENLGYSEGNNVGIRHALQQNVEFVFLLNNDTYVDPTMLSKLIEVIQTDPLIGITGPTMYYADPPNMLWGGKNWIDWRSGKVVREQMGEIIDMNFLNGQLPIEVTYIDSCAVLVRAQVFREVGLLDNRFFINFDDIDLCLRARNAGYKIMYVPSAWIWHRVSAAIGVGSPANTYYMTRNSLLFFANNSPGLYKITNTSRLVLNTARTIFALGLKQAYKADIYQRKRKANLLALRDFFFKRYGMMGPDVMRVCYSK